jgi:hypothetical protein
MRLFDGKSVPVKRRHHDQQPHRLLIVVVKITFRLSDIMLLQPLMPPSSFSEHYFDKRYNDHHVGQPGDFSKRFCSRLEGALPSGRPQESSGSERGFNRKR